MSRDGRFVAGIDSRPVFGVSLAGANAAASQVGVGVGTDLLESAKRLWAKLRPHFEARPAALEAAQDVADEPHNEGAARALEWQLTKILQDHPALVEELSPILEEAIDSGVVAVGTRNVAIRGPVVQSVINTGDNGVVQR